MAAPNVERADDPPEDLTDLATRCADWLLAERARIERELRARYEPPAAPRPAAAVPTAPVPEVAAPLIRLLDRIAELPPTPPGTADARTHDPVLDWVRRSVLAALVAAGVTAVEDSGRADPTRHNVVATRTDPSGLRSGTIAETVRPGYLWGGTVLRHQEVIAYVPPTKPGHGTPDVTHTAVEPDDTPPCPPHGVPEPDGETPDVPQPGEEGDPTHDPSHSASPDSPPGSFHGSSREASHDDIR
ncbi:nucleotide exchange factor GrpE [Streptomyces phaeolivaceus]|nr:nucleotide exchange factor GrpE [Streptomyces phaeolivaceus]